MRIIPIDHGNDAIKTLNYEFPAGLADAAGVASESIRFGDKQYAISHRRLTYLRDKTTTEDYLILTLFALARELGDAEEKVALAIGLPPAHFQSLRYSFENYFKGQYAFEYKGEYKTKTKSINIKHVLVFPQAYAAAATVASELEDKDRIFVVDIGGMTVDTLLLRNGIPDMSYTMSLNVGVKRPLNETTAALAAQLGTRAEQDQVEAVLRNKETLLPDNAKAMIDEKARAYTQHLLADLRERDVDLTTTPALFTGGGSLLLRKYIEESPLVSTRKFIETANANARGYKLLAEAVMNQ